MIASESTRGFSWRPWQEPIPAEHRSAVVTWLASYPATLPGEGMRLVRESIGLTRGELASLLGINERRVSRWENGKADADPMAERMIRAQHLKIAVNYINDLLALTEAWPQWVRFEERAEGWRLKAVQYGEQEAGKEKAPKAKPKAPKLRLVTRAA